MGVRDRPLRTSLGHPRPQGSIQTYRPRRVGLHGQNIHVRSIGVFDSGVGGLTVLRAIRKRLPRENLIYLGDTARVPYGPRSREVVLRYALECARYLLDLNVKALVVACNTSTAYALEAVRSLARIPVIGVIEPGVKRALELTRSGRIGVVGTSGTIRSGAYQALLGRSGKATHVHSIPCPLFVSLAEEGWTRGPIAREIAIKYLAPLKRARVDTLILGCTHYPLLRGAIAEVMGKGVTLVDSADTLASELERILDKSRVRAGRSTKGKWEIWATDVEGSFRSVAARFLGRSLPPVHRAVL